MASAAFDNFWLHLKTGLALEWRNLGNAPDYSALRDKGWLLPAIDDLYTILALVGTVGTALYMLQFYGLPALGAMSGLKGKGKLAKFSDSALQLIVYASLAVYEIWVCLSSDWAYEYNFFPKNLPYEMTVHMKWVYMLQIAWYTYQFVVLAINPSSRKKDVIAFVLHHIVTLFVVGTSYIYNNTRVGLVVFALHDPADVFLQTAKQFRYFGYEKMCNAVFALFALCWVSTRCAWFPHAAYYVSVDVGHLAMEGTLASTVLLQVISLWVLFVLHCYWSYLIFAMVYRSIMVKGVEKDIRSDSEDEAAEGSSTSGKKSKSVKKD